VFRIGRNTFYDRKNIIPMKILEFKRSGIGLIAEFPGIWNGFPNQDLYEAHSFDFFVMVWLMKRATTIQPGQVMNKAGSEWLITRLPVEQMEGMADFFESEVRAK
jgi:hypothetical protein